MWVLGLSPSAYSATPRHVSCDVSDKGYGLTKVAPGLPAADRIANFGGGTASACSLRQLSDWCRAQLGEHAVAADPAPRPFDLPWLVLDTAKARRLWSWAAATSREQICAEIAAHAATHPDWLERSAPL